MEMSLAVWLVTLLFCLALAQTQIQTVEFQDSGLENLLFTDDVAFTFSQEVHSVVDCAERCTGDQSCMSFTYEPGLCRGHTLAVGASSGAVPAAGARTYRRTAWLYKKCTANEECPVNHTECFKGKCLCTPGYYYSNRNDKCAEACPRSVLSKTFFVKYPQSEYSGLDYYQAEPISLESCLTTCHNGPRCRSFSYRADVARCTASHYDVLDGDPSQGTWNPVNPASDYYQKGCE